MDPSGESLLGGIDWWDHGCSILQGVSFSKLVVLNLSHPSTELSHTFLVKKSWQAGRLRRLWASMNKRFLEVFARAWDGHTYQEAPWAFGRGGGTHILCLHRNKSMNFDQGPLSFLLRILTPLKSWFLHVLRAGG